MRTRARTVKPPIHPSEVDVQDLNTHTLPDSKLPNLNPRVPLEIQELILQYMQLEGSMEPKLNHDFVFNFYVDLTQLSFLSSCRLVCRTWASLCQRSLFSWIILRNSTFLDNLISLLRESHCSHFSRYIRRISIAYEEPYFKLGEALPRIAIMAPPNLVRIDIWAPTIPGKPYRPLMYHHSLMAQLACLRNVNILCLVGFRFIHLIELRRLVACFTGLRSAIFEVEVDPDRLGEFRLLQRATNPVLSRVTHIPPGMWVLNQGLPLPLWLASRHLNTDSAPPSFLHGVRFGGAVPVISADLAMSMMRLTSSITKNIRHHTVWQWSREEHKEESESNQCALSCLEMSSIQKRRKQGLILASKGSLTFKSGVDPRLDPHYVFRFRIHNNQFNPPPFPRPNFDFSNLVEVRILCGAVDFHYIKDFCNAEELRSPEFSSSLETLGVHLLCFLPLESQDKFFDDPSQESLLDDLVSTTKPLRDSQLAYHLDITIEGFHIEDLLRMREQRSTSTGSTSGWTMAA